MIISRGEYQKKHQSGFVLQEYTPVLSQFTPKFRLNGQRHLNIRIIR